MPPVEKTATRRLDKFQLDAAFVDAHRRTRALLSDLTLEQMQVPCSPGINPPLWEYAHIAWFTEYWVLRNPQRDAACDAPGRYVATQPSLLAQADRWFDSARVPHDERWHLDLPAAGRLVDYADRVLAAVRARLAAVSGSDGDLYFFRLALYHEDMHAEALTWMRQTLDYSLPNSISMPSLETTSHMQKSRDVAIGNEPFLMGCARDAGFIFDNEKWRHAVQLTQARIDRQCVSNAQYAQFVADDGYRNERWWSRDGLAWLKRAGLNAPQRWRESRQNGPGHWEHRWFGRWEPLGLDAPVCHINAYEAEAFCRWQGRRLPTEAEWEYAATHDLIEWGSGVWEWTADAFAPYPGFSPDPYADYSAPWFYTHRSVRGASFASHERIRNPRYRNFFLPHRNDVFVGLRTCG